MLEALSALHLRRLIHRDIKPANVLVDWEDRAFLVDLGVACDRRRARLTPLHTTVGTPDFMAPEQRATGTVDQRSDLYQVGALLLHALSGRDPTTLTVEARDDLIAGIPRRFERVVAGALAAAPESRWESADAMRAALERVVDAEDVTLNVEAEDVIDVEILRIAEVGQAGEPENVRDVEPIEIEATSPVIELTRPKVARARRRARIAIAAAALLSMSVAAAAALWMRSSDDSERGGAGRWLGDTVRGQLAEWWQSRAADAPTIPVYAVAPAPPSERVRPAPEPPALPRTAPARRRHVASRNDPPSVDVPSRRSAADYLYLADLYESSGARESAVAALRLYQRALPPSERAVVEQRIHRLSER